MRTIKRVNHVLEGEPFEMAKFHQFVTVHDGDQYLVPAAIVELPDGTLDFWEICQSYRSVQFVESPND